MGGAFQTRRGARFDFITDAMAATGEHADHERDTHHVWWRVTAANNRTLGRSVQSFASLADCRAHARSVHEGIGELVTSLSWDGRGQWTWSALLDADPAARSNRPFLRRIDCVRTLALFIDAARIADVDGGDVRRFAARRTRSTAGR